MEGLSRYDVLGPIGMGGMGEVHRVRDRRLGRRLALKTLHPSIPESPLVGGSLLRRSPDHSPTATSGNRAHPRPRHPARRPGVVHDEGSDRPDLRCGDLGRAHAVSRRRWQPTASGWTLRRLVHALQQVCEAVGYAHSRGVVHRDLKPDNIMVGSHGEVLVLDWGLAKVLGRPDLAAEDGDLDPVQTDRSRASAHQTKVGQVAGTPAYMSPEQALGQIDQIDARSDVYALGALLYEVLSGCAPYVGHSAVKVLEQVRSRPPVSLYASRGSVDSIGVGQSGRSDADAAQGPPLPPSLVMACERAMARDPADRFESAGALAAELQAWLDGAKRQEEARTVVAQAEGKGPEAAALRAQAATLRTEAAALLKDVADWQPEEDKLPGWEREDAATAMEKLAELAELEEESLLRGSLTHAPDLPEAHAALAARYRADHESAETSRQDTTRAETLFRQHLAALPEDHPDRAGHLTYLKGDGALTLVTDPPGAEVLLHRYVLHNRRRVPRFERSLGTTPLRSVSLPMGSYLCVLKHPDPRGALPGVHRPWGALARNAPRGWRGDAHFPAMARELGPDDCYVPPGWFACGGDPPPGAQPVGPPHLGGWPHLPPLPGHEHPVHGLPRRAGGRGPDRGGAGPPAPAWRHRRGARRGYLRF